mgnify:CR=1 FL=1
MKLYSYVVEHEHGLSPNPSNGFCTLVHCKFNKSGKRRNIVEMANVGDWVLGTGGNSSESIGNGKIIYLMRIDEKISFKDFLNDTRFKGRKDQVDNGHGNTYALISEYYYYFGRNAINIPNEFLDFSLEKKGPGYRCDPSPNQIRLIVLWFETNFSIGAHGTACRPIGDCEHSLDIACQPTCIQTSNKVTPLCKTEVC